MFSFKIHRCFQVDIIVTSMVTADFNIHILNIDAQLLIPSKDPNLIGSILADFKIQGL